MAEKGRRRLTAGQRRERILDAATALFAERGYAGASMNEIAASAGVVVSVIYDHFPSKRALHIELLERHGDELIDTAVRRVRAESYAELFRASIEAFFEFVERDPFVWRLLFRDPPADPEVAAAWRGVQGRASRAIAALLASAVPEKELIEGLARERTNAMLAEAIKSTMDGLAGWWYEHREVPRGQVVAVAEQLIWIGLERTATALGRG